MAYIGTEGYLINAQLREEGNIASATHPVFCVKQLNCVNNSQMSRSLSA